MALPQVAAEPQTNEEAVALLQARLEESGMTREEFATEVLRRDSRVLRRWLEGAAPIPGRIVAFLVKPRAPAWPPRR